ncbi:MAG: tryptophan synthase subunit alpha [Anaerolineales bacterium]|nr:tryptophan synthase subunit alpha [Anaerolineales bacterium]
MTEATGRSHIATAFQQAKAAQRAALMPYYTLGYPDRATSLDGVAAIAPYADLFELGVPFSDPLADGPTIQHSTQKALENGTTSRDCLAMVRELRGRGVTAPFLLMGYYNPIMAYGLDAYVKDVAAAGADGLLVPDLPPEEADELEAAAAAAGLALIHFLAPTSHPARISKVVARAQGFIYAVSVTGITGARQAVSTRLPEFVGSIKAQTNVPVAVGFGISTPAQAADVGTFADGVIVGSALINAVDAAEDKPAAAAQFMGALKAGMEKATD